LADRSTGEARRRPRGAIVEHGDERGARGEQRTSLVTGANTGIGRVTALELARRGDRVLLACRSEARTRPVVDEIVAATGNCDVEFLPLDLADLDAVRDSAQVLVDRGDPLHVLVANAGLAGQRGTTAQGFELAFGTNHLGHFLFVTSLLDLLRSSAPVPGGGPSRVVVVASDSHYTAKHGIDFDAVRRPTRGITGLGEYGVSKLANVLFAQELAERVPAEELWVAAVHPGTVATDVWRRIPGPAASLMKRFMRSPEDGAATTLRCACDDDVLAADGAYWADGVVKAPSRVATPELAAELWRRSEEWVAGA
jgi:NAD(P)-dependent dehydrogenase (short-subunit alcohol dehydrogenase family)